MFVYEWVDNGNDVVLIFLLCEDIFVVVVKWINIDLDLVCFEMDCFGDVMIFGIDIELLLVVKVF